MPDEKDHSVEEHDETPSKSELKRRMHALQELGVSLLALTEKELARIPVADPDLLEALREARAISSNSARKRHLQYIGKLMRGVDPAPIEQALAELHESHRQVTAAFHELEALRDAALADGNAGLQAILERWPQSDRQKVRQLILQHQRESKRGKPPAASRKLFRYLRELQENYG